MILYNEALNIILGAASPLSFEMMDAHHALGRILSCSVKSRELLPPFANSAMDGFAYRLSDLDGAVPPFQLEVVGTIAAGDQPQHGSSTARLKAWEIMTGAPVPADCDTVIKIEDITPKDNTIVFHKSGKPNENLRRAGEDFNIGDTLATAGTRIFPEHLMAFAALGITEVPVLRHPSVSVLSTGAELAEEPTMSSGQIRNSTAPYLTAELSRLGVNPTFLGTISDDPQTFLKLIKGQVENGVDVILSTGAVSMGKYDFVASTLRDLGANILLHKVAIRPGKPLLFATLGKTAFFGIPGNPISSAVGLRFFIEPYLRQLQGLGPERATRMQLLNSVNKPEGLRCFFKARTLIEKSRGEIEILKGQESFRIGPFLAADSWAILPEEGKEMAAGSEIEVLPLHSWTRKEIAL